MSELSKLNSNQYFTNTTEVRELLAYCDELWNLAPGTKVLEPSVGSGAFPLTAERLGYELKWITNELHPDCTNYQATHNADFLTLPPEPVDLVVGNPPYTGQVEYNGNTVPLWLSFVLRSFEWADRVAFVLPLPALTWNFLSRLPESVKVVGWTTPKPATYVLGGVGASDTKEVRTTTVLFEKVPGFNGYQFNPEPPEGFEWVETGATEATHGVSLTLRLGEARCLRKSWGRRFPFSEKENQARVTCPRIEALLASNVIHEFARDYTQALPALQRKEFNHYLTVLAGC